jgi:hypothetical protein
MVLRNLSGLKKWLVIGPVVAGLVSGAVFGTLALAAAITSDPKSDDHLINGIGFLLFGVLTGLTFWLVFTAFSPRPATSKTQQYLWGTISIVSSIWMSILFGSMMGITSVLLTKNVAPNSIATRLALGDYLTPVSSMFILFGLTVFILLSIRLFKYKVNRVLGIVVILAGLSIYLLSFFASAFLYSFGNATWL